MPKGNKNPSGNPETMHCRKRGVSEVRIQSICAHGRKKSPENTADPRRDHPRRVYYLGNRHASKGITKKTASAVFIYIISRAFLFLGRARRVRPE